MRFKGTKLSNRTVALFAAAILLLSSGGFLGVKAAPTITGQSYDATIELDDISVQLMENGNAAGDSGLLASTTAAKPGMTYKESISVNNDGSAPEFVRLVVRKYWTDADNVKDTELDPGLIELGLAEGWKENKSEATDEMSVYYLTSQLGVGDVSEAIKSVRVDKSIASAKNKPTTTQKGNKTVYTYTYKYDGYSFNIEAEAQSVQTHNANDAIRSIWGVDDVTASGNTLTVK